MPYRVESSFSGTYAPISGERVKAVIKCEFLILWHTDDVGFISKGVKLAGIFIQSNRIYQIELINKSNSLSKFFFYNNEYIRKHLQSYRFWTDFRDMTLMEWWLLKIHNSNCTGFIRKYKTLFVFYAVEYKHQKLSLL